jgi:hypothetical protein
MRLLTVGAVAAAGGLLLVGLPAPAANADSFDFRTGRMVCTSFQCQIGSALNNGDASAAASAALRMQQAATQRQSPAQQKVADSYVRIVEVQSSGSSSSSGGDAASDAYAQQMNECYAALKAWQSQQGVSTPAPGAPASPYDHECIASTPDISVSYSTRMPTFDILGECIEKVYVKWGYTQGGNTNPWPTTLYGGEGYDGDYHGEVWNGQLFTPPLSENSDDDGVWFSALNHVGEVGPFHPGDSIGYAGWYPQNSPDGLTYRNSPGPVPISPKPPGELNAERALALAEETASVTVAPSARIKKGRMTVKGEPNTDYIVVARKGKKIKGTWSVTTNARGVGKIKGVSVPRKARLLVTKAPE